MTSDETDRRRRVILRIVPAALVTVVLVPSSIACSACSTSSTAPPVPVDASAMDAATGSHDGGAMDAGAPDGAPADASTAGDTSTPTADSGLLTAPSIWSASPAGSGCMAFGAQVVPDPFPPRVWQSCGVGCLVSSAGAPIAGFVSAAAGTTGGTYASGDVFLLVDGTYNAPGSLYFEQLFRLSDGVTFAATEIRNPQCVPCAGVVDAPTAFCVSDGTISLVGRGSVTMPAPVTWQNGWLPNPSITLFRFADNDGIGFTFYDGTARILSSPDAGAWTTLSANGRAIQDTSSRAKLVMWAEWSSISGTIQGYASALGAATYVSQAGYWQSSVRLSDDRLGWISVQGPEATSGAYTSAQIFSSPVPTSPADVVITAGPTLSATSALSDLAIGGDYAAVTGCMGSNTASCKIFVVQFSTGMVWTLGPRPGGNKFMQVLAVSPTEVVLAEADESENQSFFQRIVRLTIANIGSLGW